MADTEGGFVRIVRMGGSGSDDDEEGKGGRVNKRPPEFKPAGSPGDDPLTRNLKRVYEQVAAEPVPEHLMKLLDQFDDGSEGGANG